jgi:cyclic pyranopterin phosphate synthase
MFDSFNRRISYLRISVTDRCNLRCTYCMPQEGIEMLSHNDILSLEEIVEVVKAGIPYGIEKVRITGGEPLIRKGIVRLVEMLSAIPQIKDLSLTTNGLLLEEMAYPLFKAGIKRLNISLDTMDPMEYERITRGGNLEKVIRGIKESLKVGFAPIKINCVVKKDRFEASATKVAEFCYQNSLIPRFIKHMDLNSGEFGVVDGGSGGDCTICNRLRLTSNGMLKPCLFDNLEFDVRKLGANEAFRQAIKLKPACGSKNNSGAFYNIGG